MESLDSTSISDDDIFTFPAVLLEGCDNEKLPVTRNFSTETTVQAHTHETT